MESGSQQNACSWEEDIYWNNFQYTHFSSFLHSDFNTRLVIPTTFANRMRAKLPATVNLKGPSGNSWNVGVSSFLSDDETLFFSNGWKEFAQDHFLQANDLLIFRYNGDSLFDVLVFDLESCCEKASSYFARKHEARKKLRRDSTPATSAAGFIAPSKPTTCQPVISELPNKRARTGWMKPSTSRDQKSEAEKSRRKALKLASYFTDRKQGTGGTKNGGNFVASAADDGKGIPPTPDKTAENCFDATPPLPSFSPAASESPSKRARAEMTNPIFNCSGWKPAAEESNRKAVKSAGYFSVGMEGSTTATKSVSSEGFVCNDGGGDNKGTPPAAEKSADDGSIGRKTPQLPSCPPIISELSNKRARAELTKPVVTNHDRSSGWKTVSEESKLKAIKAARSALTEDGFITVMKTTHVKTFFYMSIPIAWIKKHMDERAKQDVILRVGGKEWRVRFKLREKRDSGGLTHGWRTFAEDNNLQQFDVCLFQPSKSMSCYNVPGGPDIVLDVNIFRC